MHAEHDRFPRTVADPAAGEGPEAGYVELDGLQHQQREEQVPLMARDEPGQAALGARLAGRERQRADVDVRILFLLVRVGVVAVVLVDPPAVAEPDGQVAVHQPDDVVGALGPEYLLVSGVVADEADLREHTREEDGHHELPPRIAQQDEDRPAGDQQCAGGGDACHVVARPFVQQPGVLDPAQQLGVVATTPGRLRRRDGAVRADGGARG